jgi:hypothetical protein
LRSKILFAVVVAALVFGAAECSKKKTVAENPEPLAGEPEGARAEAAEESAPRGWLEVKGAGLEGQEVRKAGTYEKVELVSATRSVVPLPPGTYDVVFGRSLWKGVVVVEGRTASLVPGWISVAHASLEGHEIVEEASGIVQGSVSALKDTIALVPGRYVIMFGKLPWPVELRAGETLTLRPGIVEVPYADASGSRIYDRSGAVVGGQQRPELHPSPAGRLRDRARGNEGPLLAQGRRHPEIREGIAHEAGRGSVPGPDEGITGRGRCPGQS